MTDRSTLFSARLMRVFACLFVLLLADPATAACRVLHTRNAVTKRVVSVTVCGWGDHMRGGRL